MLERERSEEEVYLDLTMAEPWRSESEGAVVDGIRTPTPGSTTRAGRATAQGVEHAMEGGRKTRVSSKTTVASS